MGFFRKLKAIISLNERNYDGYEDFVPASTIEIPIPRPRINSDSVESANNNIVGTTGLDYGNSQILLIEPYTFDEMSQVIDALHQQKSVILNIGLIRPEEAQRSMDFATGGTYAIDGHYEKISEKVFLFTPSCVQVTTLTNVFNEIVQAPIYLHRSVTVRNWISEVIAY